MDDINCPQYTAFTDLYLKKKLGYEVKFPIPCCKKCGIVFVLAFIGRFKNLCYEEPLKEPLFKILKLKQSHLDAVFHGKLSETANRLYEKTFLNDRPRIDERLVDEKA